ncbi:tripartite tricarboxylate transporter TctB family protein [Thalassovita taeanensis]|uniref:Tripartite tricarboxylate transporter TctB family protein n=1 Tax=Thalassovita taeanensis TaxID=657014 RepID=A0A1H9AVU9_9RHOB|nr:tripartite tricarboxylate transporter TctB family protein [Thalassovita taeanensis]SEP80543.1 Tripartite tricarboxylate transporter TctB family protein [Thalassovita taeanensis]
MSSEDPSRPIGRRSGQLLFALGFVILSALLLSQITEQTKWAAKTKFFAQPRFWPAVSLAGMVLFGGLHLWRLPRRRYARADGQEARIWLASLEYALWFLAYVWLVPLAGYLPTTLVFMPLMVWRLGYRDRRMLWISAGLGFAIVVLFKSLLHVRIPGGAIYEYLPGAMRNFFILNF